MAYPSTGGLAPWHLMPCHSQTRALQEAIGPPCVDAPRASGHCLLVTRTSCVGCSPDGSADTLVRVRPLHGYRKTTKTTGRGARPLLGSGGMRVMPPNGAPGDGEGFGCRMSS
jgi:hypothetical protein